MEITLADASGRRGVVENLNQLYLYDFVEFADADVDEGGLYTCSYLDAYWSDEGHSPIPISVDEAPAGFALVRPDASGGRSIEEFFVMRKFRRKRVGERAAAAIHSAFRVSGRYTRWRATPERWRSGGRPLTGTPADGLRRRLTRGGGLGRASRSTTLRGKPLAGYGRRTPIVCGCALRFRGQWLLRSRRRSVDLGRPAPYTRPSIGQVDC